jgi:hypothetical protein
MTPFEFLDSINHEKKYLMDNPLNEKSYDAFIVNSGLSQHIDTLSKAQDMNINYLLDSKMQYDYLFHGVRKGKRYAKWAKKDKALKKEIEIVQKYFGYSYDKARVAYSILDKKQIKYMKELLEQGVCLNVNRFT